MRTFASLNCRLESNREEEAVWGHLVALDNGGVPIDTEERVLFRWHPNA